LGDKVVTAFVKNILATVIAAGIVANVACLYSFNARLAAIEAVLKVQPIQQAKN
jgi:hypothetical protein